MIKVEFIEPIYLNGDLINHYLCNSISIDLMFKDCHLLQCMNMSISVKSSNIKSICGK